MCLRSLKSTVRAHQKPTHHQRLLLVDPTQVAALLQLLILGFWVVVERGEGRRLRRQVGENVSEVVS